MGLPDPRRGTRGGPREGLKDRGGSREDHWRCSSQQESHFRGGGPTGMGRTTTSLPSGGIGVPLLPKWP